MHVILIACNFYNVSVLNNVYIYDYYYYNIILNKNKL